MCRSNGPTFNMCSKLPTWRFQAHLQAASEIVNDINAFRYWDYPDPTLQITPKVKKIRTCPSSDYHTSGVIWNTFKRKYKGRPILIYKLETLRRIITIHCYKLKLMCINYEGIRRRYVVVISIFVSGICLDHTVY